MKLTPGGSFHFLSAFFIPSLCFPPVPGSRLAQKSEPPFFARVYTNRASGHNSFRPPSWKLVPSLSLAWGWDGITPRVATPTGESIILLCITLPLLTLIQSQVWKTPGKGGSTPLYGLNGNVRPERVWLSGCFVLNGISNSSLSAGYRCMTWVWMHLWYLSQHREGVHRIGRVVVFPVSPVYNFCIMRERILGYRVAFKGSQASICFMQLM